MAVHARTRSSAQLLRRAFLEILAVLLALAAPGRAKAQARKIELGDLQKIVNVSSPEISPDGKSIVIVVSRVNWDEDRYDSQLVLVDIATGSQRVLTNIRKGLSSPQFSPAGDRLAFLAETGWDAKNDAKEEKKSAPQIFVLPMNGGEPQPITRAPLGVEQFAWRPDGAFVAFASPDEPPNKAEIEKHHDLFEVGDNDFLATSAPTPSHIWLVSSSGGTAKRLTSGTWSLSKSAPPSSPSSPLSWSPDGKQISFTRQADPHDGDPNNENEIFITSSTGGEGTDFTHALDRDIQRAIWMPDSKSLFLAGHDGTRTAIWIQPLNGAARKIDLDAVNPTFSSWLDTTVGKDGSIAFAGATP